MRSRLRALRRTPVLGAVGAALVVIGAVVAATGLPGSSTGAAEPAPVTEAIAATGSDPTPTTPPPAADTATADTATAARAAADQAAAAQAAADAEAFAAYLAALPHTAPDDYWDRMASCETGGNWAMTGSRYSGGVGFANSTWAAFGGLEFAPNAGQATREQQIVVANRVAVLGYGGVRPAGYGAWGCTARVGRP